MPNKPIHIMVMAVGIVSLWSCTIKSPHSAGVDGVEHVVVIGFDGLSPDGLKKAKTPNFDTIISQGAYTLHARAVLPTSSSSNWSSMIMGAGPEQHGITSNQWERNSFVLPAVTQSEDFVFPTVFSLMDKQIKDAEIGAIYHWKGFGRLFEKNAVDYDVHGETEDKTAELAKTYIKTKKPTFAFIHFDHVDHAGHEFGHGTEAYYNSVEKADNLLGEVMGAIKEAGIADNTLVIISADHGGIGKGHGGETLNEIEIPFILWGNAIKKRFKIKYPIYQYDNAATVAFALNLKTPHAWIGKPPKMAFNGYNSDDSYPVTEWMPQPVMLPKGEFNKKAGGLFDNECIVAIKNPNGLGEVHYTTDGSMPTKASNRFTEPFTINETTVVKSALFINGKMASTVSDAFYRIKPAEHAPPISYKLFYLDNLSSVPHLEGRTPNIVGNCFEITSDEIKDKIKQHTAVKFSTQLHIDKAGSYGFFTRSDDGSKLWVDGKEVVDNDGNHGVKEKGGGIELAKGMHDLEVIWYNGGEAGWLDVYLQSETLPKQILPTVILK